MAVRSGTLVCGVDKVDAREVVRVAKGLADRLALRIVLFHAARPVPVDVAVGAPHGWHVRRDADLGIEAGDAFLAQLAGAEGLVGHTRLRVDTGPAAERLVEVASEEDAELLVLGCRSRSGLAWALLGSVSAAVVPHAPCPVVVVPPGADGDSDGPVICGVDRDEASIAARDLAWNLASRLEARLLVVHASDVAAEDGDAGELAVFAPHVRAGAPPEVLRAVADEEQAQLIVVGSRGHGPLRAALLGSTSRSLMTAAPCPVVVVPPRVWKRDR